MSEAKFTKGPWAWFGCAGGCPELYLATAHSGRRYVMGFQRWGMDGAQPTFQPNGRGMVKAKDLLQFEVGDRSVVGIDAARADNSVYRYQVRGIDAPDAYLIAAAPELYEALRMAAKDLNTAAHFLPDIGLALFETVKQAYAALAKARGEA